MDAVPVIQVLRSLRTRAGGPPAEPTDGRLLDRFARLGDAAAFAGLVRRHGPMVLGVCRRLLRDSHDADDAFQATFLVLVRKAVGLRDPESLGPWLYGVAYRTALRGRARAARRRAQERPLGELPAGDAADADLGGALDDAIGRLPAKYRTPFVLCHLEGLTQAQAARRLGCPPATIATRLMRARQRLRERLAGQGVAPTAVVLPVALAEATVRAAADLRAGRALPVGVAALMKGAGMTMMVRTRAVLLAVAVLAVGGGTGLMAMREPAADDPPQVVAPPVAEIPPPAAPAEAEKPGAFRTANFEVYAANARIARLIGETAERARKEQALAWLGRELLPWPQPCPIRVTNGMSGTGGATEFDFDNGKVRGQRMRLEGPLERLLTSVLPHEVTHTVFAHHFGRPIPRWADEGAAIMAEDEEERKRHEQLMHDLLDHGRGIRLATLFKLTEFPQDVMVLYTQGYSVTRFLVERGGPSRFIALLKDGMTGDWDKAVRAHFGFKDVKELEGAWLASLRLQAPAVFTAETPPELSAGSAPLNAVAVLADGCVAVRWPLHYYQPRVSPEGKAIYELIAGEDRHTYVATALKARTADGREVSPDVLAARLKKETPVLVAVDGKPVDPFYLQLIKPDALILIPPALRPPPQPAPPVSNVPSP